MKRSKSGNRWQDHYTRQAKKDKYPARSVYKLKEIQQKNRIIRKGDAVLDLGCAPGSWLKYAAEVAGPTGRVVGIDLKPVTIALPDQVEVLTGDIYEMLADLKADAGAGYNVVLSDMAPATTGSKHVDAARTQHGSLRGRPLCGQRCPETGRAVCL